jgi:hypothetical protein
MHLQGEYRTVYLLILYGLVYALSLLSGRSASSVHLGISPLILNRHLAVHAALVAFASLASSGCGD